MKLKPLIFAFAAAIPVAACNTADTTATQNQPEASAEEQAAKRAAFDLKTANGILNCTTGAKAKAREMKPNWKNEFNQERLDWHKTSLDKCVLSSSGNFFTITYGVTIRDEISQQLHDAEIAAYKAKTAPAYPSAEDLAKKLSNSRR